MEQEVGMDMVIDAEEGRVLGCLLEKEMATPEYYPLSLNALLNACNQKSNRNPVVSYDTSTLVAALQRLVDKDLVFETRLSRVPKFEELIMKQQNLVSREASILCVLLLRGPQTMGEIKVRTERLYPFESLDQVGETLTDLAASGFVERIARQPGQKEDRYGHCFFAPDAPPQQSSPQPPETFAPTDAKSSENPQIQDQLLGLENTVAELSDELNALKKAFEAFKNQFE